jgi:C-terminal processing protease CtpA/Prc
MMHELERFRMVALATLCGVVLSTSPAASQELPQVTAADANHAIVKEALTVVEEHFIDLKNPKGVADSSTRQVFNGVDWKALEAAEAEKALKDRGASYTEIASALKKLGDKYTRFVKPSDFAKLTKYDVTGVGVLIVEKDGRLVSVIQYSLLVLKYQTSGTSISNEQPTTVRGRAAVGGVNCL